MKRIIRISLFSVLLAIAISSTRMSALSQKIVRTNLVKIFSLNVAYGEDDPIYTVKYEVVNCVRTYPVGSNGQTIEVHTVTCYGVGSKECKCTGH